MFELSEIIFDEEPHTYSFRGEVYDSVTQVIQIAGLGDDFSKVNPDRLEYARKRGRLVHLACQYYDEGKLDLNSIDPAIAGYVEGYIKFRRDKKIEPIAIEQMFISPKHCATCAHPEIEHQNKRFGCLVPGCICLLYDQGLGVAGTPDLICFMNGRRVVIDRKTAQNMSASMGIQTAGYKMIVDRQDPRHPIQERYGLRLEKKGDYRLVPNENGDDGPCFLDCLRYATEHHRLDRWRPVYAR